MRAAFHEAGRAAGCASISELIEAATLRGLERLQRKYNGGKPWPGVPASTSRAGRPRKIQTDQEMTLWLSVLSIRAKVAILFSHTFSRLEDMAPIWKPSTGKHGVPRTGAISAIVNAGYSDVLGDEVPEGYVKLCIGRPHLQSRRELEVLVNHFDDGREAVVFHVMELGPTFRRYREENPR